MTLDPTTASAPAQIRAALDALRQDDLPTHGGRTLSYVYDSGLAEADEIGREALAAFGATNGLDLLARPVQARVRLTTGDGVGVPAVLRRVLRVRGDLDLDEAGRRRLVPLLAAGRRVTEGEARQGEDDEHRQSEGGDP